MMEGNKSFPKAKQHPSCYPLKREERETSSCWREQEIQFNSSTQSLSTAPVWDSSSLPHTRGQKAPKKGQRFPKSHSNSWEREGGKREKIFSPGKIKQVKDCSSLKQKRFSLQKLKERLHYPPWMTVRNPAGHRGHKTFFIQQSTDGLWREMGRTWSGELLKTKQPSQAALLSVGHTSQAGSNADRD